MAYKSVEVMKQYHHDLYRWYVEHGVCWRCKKVDAEPGRVYCKRCTQKRKALNDRSDPGRKERNAYLRDRYAALKAEGLCTDCGKRRPEEGHIRCSVCRRKRRESEQVGRIRKRIGKNTIKQRGG